MEISDQDFSAAADKAAAVLSGPVAVSAGFDAEKRALIVTLTGGAFVGYPVEKLEGLRGATDEELGNVIVQAKGLGLHWPDLDADVYVPALLANIFGSRNWMAAQLGAAGGKKMSSAKSEAARFNGRKGGRPKKQGGVAA